MAEASSEFKNYCIDMESDELEWNDYAVFLAQSVTQSDIEWLKTRDSPSSKFALGMCYQFKQEFKLAFDQFSLGLSPKYANSIFYLARCYYNGAGVTQNYAMSAVYYNEAASMDHIEAITELGVLYYFGLGIDRNPELAFEQFQKATDLAGCKALKATVNMGICYLSGHGTEMDQKKALKLFRMAAECGSSDAINCIGLIYQYGLGVAVNVEQAQMLYRIAANMGNMYAIRNIANMTQQ